VVLSFLPGSGACMITLLLGRVGEFFKGTAVFQEFRGCGMPCNGLEGSDVGCVSLLKLVLCITFDLSNPGWAVEIELDVQVIPVEVIDASGMALGNVRMPMCVRTIAPFSPSPGAVSWPWRERDWWAAYGVYSTTGRLHA
jgi:hypothetical protein